MRGTILSLAQPTYSSIVNCLLAIYSHFLLRTAFARVNIGFPEEVLIGLEVLDKNYTWDEFNPRI